MCNISISVVSWLCGIEWVLSWRCCAVDSYFKMCVDNDNLQIDYNLLVSDICVCVCYQFPGLPTVLITWARSGLVYRFGCPALASSSQTTTDNADDQAPSSIQTSWREGCLEGERVCVHVYVMYICMYIYIFLLLIFLSLSEGQRRDLNRGKSTTHSGDWRFKRRNDGVDSLVWAASNDRSSDVSYVFRIIVGV